MEIFLFSPKCLKIIDLSPFQFRFNIRNRICLFFADSPCPSPSGEGHFFDHFFLNQTLYVGFCLMKGGNSMVQLQRTCHPTEERVNLTHSQAMTTPATDCSGMRLRNEVLRAVGRTAATPVSRGPPKTSSSCDASAGSQKRDGGYIPKKRNITDHPLKILIYHSSYRTLLTSSRKLSTHLL